MKESGHQASMGQKQADKPTQLQTDATLSRKRKMGRQGAGQGTQCEFGWWVSKLLGAGDSLFFCSLPFFVYLFGCVWVFAVASSIFHFSTDFQLRRLGLKLLRRFSLLEWERLQLLSCTLSHNCALGADNLFSSFTSPEMERNSAPGWIIPSATDFR